MYKIIFFGTSEFAVPSFRVLHHDPRFAIVGVVTQPDRPVGRHAVMTPPAVKRAVDRLQVTGYRNIRIEQPEKLKEEPFASWIREVGPSCDAFVIVSYGKILPQWLIDLPKHGVVNVHGSLLPRWRGPSPIQAAIAAGDAVTGVTIMKLDAEMDHGPILGEIKEVIRPDDAGSALHDRLASLGAKNLPDMLANYLAGNLKPVEQNHAQATYCKILTRDDGKIDWMKSAEEIQRLVRAYDPWPGTWTLFDGKRLKILAAHVGIVDATRESGEHFVRDGKLFVACGGASTLEILRVQLEGKVAMLSRNYIRGRYAW